MSFFEDCIQRGDRASQPAASSVIVGTLYYVTDEGVTERSSGSAWEDCSDAGSGAVTGPGSSTDNGIARFNGAGGGTLQDTSGPTLEDDGTIANLTDPANNQDAATKKYVDDTAAAIVAFTDERAQDAVGLMVDGVTLEYVDATPLLQVKDLGISTGKLAAGAATYAKIQDVSATSRILLRKTAGSGSVEEGTIEDALNFIASLASGDILYHDGSSFVRLAKGSTGQRLKTGTPPSWADQYRVIKFTFDGGTSTPSADSKARVTCPVAGTIVRARIYADQSGSAVVDIWKDTWANYPPTVADTITASAKPTLSTAISAEDTTLTGWTTAVSAGDAFIANLDSVTTCTQVNVELWIKES